MKKPDKSIINTIRLEDLHFEFWKSSYVLKAVKRQKNQY